MLPLLLPLITHVIANIIQLVHAVLFHFVRGSCWEGYGSRCERYSGTPGTAVGWFHEFSFFLKKKARQLVTLFSFACISSLGLLQKRKTVHILLASLQASAQDFTLGVQDLSLGFACVFPAQRSLLEVRSWFFGLSKQRRSQRRRLV